MSVTEQQRAAWQGWILGGLWVGLASWTVVWLRRVAPAGSGWDFNIYLTAAVVARDGNNPFESLQIGTGYLNHPIVLSLLQPWLVLNDVTLQLWSWRLLMLGSWVASLWLLQGIATGTQSIRQRPRRLIWLLLPFGPFLEAFYVGQLTPFALLFLLLFLRASSEKRWYGASATLTGAILLKTSPAAVLAWLLLQRRWLTLGGVFLLFAVATLIPMAQFYPTIGQDFSTTMSWVSANVHIASLNQSLRSLIGVTLQAGEIESGWLVGLEPIAWATVMGVVGLGSWRFGDRVNRPVLALFCVALTLFSPLVWYHHLLFLLPAVALLWAHGVNRIWLICVLYGVQAVRLFEFVPYLGSLVSVAVQCALLVTAAAAILSPMGKKPPFNHVDDFEE